MFFSRLSVDVCTAPRILNVRWADSHLATLRNGNSALPLQNPVGMEKKENRECLFISKISEDRKIYLMRLCVVSLSFRMCGQMPF